MVDGAAAIADALVRPAVALLVRDAVSMATAVHAAGRAHVGGFVRI